MVGLRFGGVCASARRAITRAEHERGGGAAKLRVIEVAGIGTRRRMLKTPYTSGLKLELVEANSNRRRWTLGSSIRAPLRSMKYLQMLVS